MNKYSYKYKKMVTKIETIETREVKKMEECV